jgi:hypothetical protein
LERRGPSRSRYNPEFQDLTVVLDLNLEIDTGLTATKGSSTPMLPST